MGLVALQVNAHTQVLFKCGEDFHLHVFQTLPLF